MKNCIGCTLKYVFVTYSPIYISCLHEDSLTSVAKISKRHLIIYCSICLSVLTMLLFYSYLLKYNYCTAYTLKCMISLNDFFLYLTGFIVMFFKLLKLRTSVASLNGWITLEGGRKTFCIHYVSFDRVTRLLKR